MAVASHELAGAARVAGASDDRPFSALTHDVFWFLVLPQAEESRVSQLAIARPFREGDLSDELRPHPMDATPR